MRLGLAVVLFGVASGCTASDEEVRPPNDQFYFPTGLVVTPDDSILFVTNGNSELRYDSGTVSVIDLALVDQVAADWSVGHNAPSNCSQDTDHTETLVCDETQFMKPSAGARIGNFATAVGIQDRGDGNLRLMIPARGDPSVTWVDWDGSGLHCNSNGQSFELCDDTHRLTYVHNDSDVGYLPEEPFDVFVDSVNQYAVVTHLTTGDVSLIDSPANGDAVIADVQVGLFAADTVTGILGSTGVSGRMQNGNDIVYVGSRSEDRIQTFTVARPQNDVLPSLVQGNYFFLDSVGGNAGGSEDTRGMTFSPDGNRMYLINRDPPSLQVFDTSLKDTGFPANRGIGASDICRNASTLTSIDAGDGERVYVTCFSDGEVYVVDPRGESFVENILEVGRGPYAIAASTSRKKVYVTNFLEDTVAVIDVAPGSPTRNQVVLRIGEVKPP